MTYSDYNLSRWCGGDANKFQQRRCVDAASGYSKGKLLRRAAATCRLSISDRSSFSLRNAYVRLYDLSLIHPIAFACVSLARAASKTAHNITPASCVF